jgi:hypothetical protein
MSTSSNSVGRLTATQENDRSAATFKKDRSRLCAFTFADGRQCRTPRAAKHRHLCFYHAQKEARSRAADTLGKDLDYFFSGNYLSACDLSTALGRLIPAVVRGDLKPRTAHTVAYLAQTLMQAIHISQHEYINAFGTDGWRRSIRNSVNDNYDYRFPPAPEPKQAQPQPASPPLQPASVPHPGIHPDSVGRGEASSPPQPSVSGHSERSEESASSSNSSLATHHSSLPQPLPRTSAEFAEQVVARLNSSRSQEIPTLSRPGAGQAPQSEIPTLSGPAPAPSPTSASTPQPPRAIPVNPERSQDSALSSNLPLATHHSPLPTQPTPLAVPPQPNSPPPAAPPTPQRGPNRDAPWLNWGDQSHIPPDSHLL